MQERKQLKLSNSLPSFKPFVNKGIKKSVFNNKNIRPNSALNLNLKLEIKKYKNINYKNKKKGNKGNKTSMSSYNNMLFYCNVCRAENYGKWFINGEYT